MVVVSPASAVALVTPNANKAVSPSRDVPAVVPNPGNDVLPLLVVIAPLCATEIVVVSPASAVVLVAPRASKAVSPSNDVPVVVPNPGKLSFNELFVIAVA